MDTRSDIILRAALKEDMVFRDITSQKTVGKDQHVRAYIVAKEECVIAGLPHAKKIFQWRDRRIRFRAKVREGRKVRRGGRIAEISGSARSILSAERAALNILQHLSGISTTTRRVVESTKQYRVLVLDTRKTLPGLRALQKYAVRVGGGKNHRSSLADAILIKNNHIAVAGGIGKVLMGIPMRERNRIQIEVRNLREAKAAIQKGARKLLLDNLAPIQLKKLVRSLRSMRPGGLWLEASGGITPQNASDFARTGVDAISLGALTHSPRAVDLSLRILTHSRL